MGLGGPDNEPSPPPLAAQSPPPGSAPSSSSALPPPSSPSPLPPLPLKAPKAVRYPWGELRAADWRRASSPPRTWPRVRAAPSPWPRAQGEGGGGWRVAGRAGTRSLSWSRQPRGCRPGLPLSAAWNGPAPRPLPQARAGRAPWTPGRTNPRWPRRSWATGSRGRPPSCGLSPGPADPTPTLPPALDCTRRAASRRVRPPEAFGAAGLLGEVPAGCARSGGRRGEAIGGAQA